MRESRLIEILRTFNKEEVKSFEMFLDSPFVKTRRNIGVLLSYLKKYHPDYTSERLSKEIAFEKLFPDERYQEKKIINLMSGLTKAAEDFLKHDALDKDEIESLLFISMGYHNKKLLNHSMRVLKTVEKKLKPGFSQNRNYFSKFRQLTHLKNAYYTEISDFDNVIECEKNYFEVLAVQFIIGYVNLMVTKDTVQTTYGKKLGNQFIETIMKSFDIEKLFMLTKKGDFIDTPLIAIHYYLLKMIDEPNNEKYFSLMKKLFYKNIEKFDREEKYFLFNNLLNHRTRKFNKRNKVFQMEMLEVYKKMLENDAYSNSGSEYMPVLAYRNIIFACSILKETKWFEYFIEKYNYALSPDYREDMKNLAYGHLLFIKKEFERALVNVSKIDHEFFLFKSDVKNLMLKIYYELNYTEQSFSLVDAYKHFLSNTKEITQTYKETYNNFLTMYFELLKIKSGHSKEDPEFIKSKIEKENNIVNKPWLLEKAAELKVKS